MAGPLSSANRITVLLPLLLLVACAEQPQERVGEALGRLTTEPDPPQGADDPNPSSETEHDVTVIGGDAGPLAERGPQAACGPQAGCDDVTSAGERCLPTCDARCTRSTSRYSFWVTQYDVGDTLGWGEHQGVGIIGWRYTVDARFGADAGISQPWLHDDGSNWAVGDVVDDATQFRLRTQNPGGEDAADEPTTLEAPSIQDAALCAVESLIDRRQYNHGRTLAETVPRGPGDEYFAARSLIPMRLLAAFDVDDEPDDASAGCLAHIEDGYCDAVCGNCSYSADLNNPNVDWTDVTLPGGQLPSVDLPNGGSPLPVACAEDPATLTSESHYNCGRTTFAIEESGREVFYVGGSIWGPGDDAEQDGVAWMSMASGDWPDPFTHCYDPAATFPQQTPFGALFVGDGRMLTGKWGHNSNSDAEASLRHFLGCAADPIAYQQEAVFNADVDGSPCTACGTPQPDEAGRVVQQPCVDATQTGSLAWGYDSWLDTRGYGTSANTLGIHNVSDLSLGRYTSVERDDAAFSVASTWADLPKPLCAHTGDPIYGM